MKLDKSTWVKFKLSDVITKKEENDRENAHNRFDRFLKVEHMDAGSIHIKRWASQKNGDEINPTFYKIFRKGQILFPTRNPHLRRTALASFDGICGEKTLTLEPNSNVILPEFIPFLFHSESFYTHTTSSIIGSTNPHCRWRDVANYELLLPPKAQQAEIAELLWAMEEVIQNESELMGKLTIGLEVKASSLIWDELYPKESLVSYACTSLGKLKDGDWIESKDQAEGGIRLLQLADIGVREFINKSKRYISEETFIRLKCFEVFPEDVLIARMPDPIGRACIVEAIGERMITAVDCCVLRVDKAKATNKFLVYLLNTREFLHKASMLASGSTRQRIARKALEEIKVPLPKLDEQIDIVESLGELNGSLHALERKYQASINLQKSLISQVF